MPGAANLVHQLSIGTGTGDLDLIVVNGKQTFASAFGTGGSNVFDYFASHRGAAEWERGTGHIDAGTGALVRDTPIESTNGNGLVAFSAGTKDITFDIPAGQQLRGPDAAVTDENPAVWNGTGGRTLKQITWAAAKALLALVKGDVGLGNVDNVQQLPMSYLDTDGTLAANSDVKVASQKAVKTYADQLIAAADAMVFKGVIDASANPNYPAAGKGDTYRISVAGKIGGASGPNVEVGDLILALADGLSAGNHATVGANWSIAQTNIDGAVVGPASVTDARVAAFDGTTGKLLKQGTQLVADLVSGPSSVTTGRVATFNGTTGKIIAQGTRLEADLVAGPASATTARIATFNGTGGKTIQDGGSTIAGVLARANHTGTQLAATISDFNAAAAAAVAPFGDYTPTLTNVTNLDDSTATSARWQALPGWVEVFGQVAMDPTSTGAVVMEMSLPPDVTTDLTAVRQLIGHATSASGAALASIFANAANDTAEFRWVATSVGSQTFYFHFRYRR